MNWIFLALVTIVYSPWVFAFEPVQGDFAAERDCPAFVSIQRNTNPGAVQIRAGQRYPALGLNKAGGDYIQIEVATARPAQRWVSLNCGHLGANSAAPVPPDATVSDKPAANIRQSKDYLLAISWQPAFCQAHQSKTECRNQTTERFDATHFTLHGLWPEPIGNDYCRIPPQQKSLDMRKQWDALPEPQLSAETAKRLNEVMPGTASNLNRHEWIKHGSCDGRDADTYFATAINLLDQINQSALRELISSRIGQRVTIAEIQTAFASDFGRAGANQVAITCDKGLISEIQIAIGRPDPSSKLADVLKTGRQQHTQCRGGLIDRVGF